MIVCLAPEFLQERRLFLLLAGAFFGCFVGKSVVGRFRLIVAVHWLSLIIFENLSVLSEGMRAGHDDTFSSSTIISVETLAGLYAT
jgi:hypothetical protein